MRYIIREVMGTRKVQHSKKFGYYLVNANEDKYVFDDKISAEFVRNLLEGRCRTILKVFEVGAKLI